MRKVYLDENIKLKTLNFFIFSCETNMQIFSSTELLIINKENGEIFIS